MSIAPNGVSIADFDPLGVGAGSVFAGFEGVDNIPLEFGDTVSGENLRPASTVENAQIVSFGSPFGATTTWMCLGRIHGSAGKTATNFIRIS